MNKSALRSIVVSPDDVTQMSPFSDERWDIDYEENRKRREIHRNYVYNQNQTHQRPREVEELPQPPPPPQEPQPEIIPPPQQEVTLTFEPPNFELDKDFKFEAKSIYKPKTMSELRFDTPAPPDLFPLLKFPQKKVKPEDVYCLPSSEVYVPSQQQTENKKPELPPVPKFNVFENVKFERPKVEHYGTYVPLWQF